MLFRSGGDEAPAPDASLSVTLSTRQARATRLALEHLAWSASPQDRIAEDARGALQALDTAAEAAHMDLTYHDEPPADADRASEAPAQQQSQPG